MKKLNGYRLTHRNKWILIKTGLLSVQELALWEFYADIFDFDKNHLTYGLFEIDFEEIAQLFNCSTSTIRNWHKKLLKLGLIKTTDKKHIFQLVCFERYVNPGRWEGKANYYQKIEKDQPIEKILQSFDINLQSIENNLQSIEKILKDKPIIKTKSSSIAIGSYKDEYKDSTSNQSTQPQQIQRTGEDYKKIKEEMGFKLLTEEDMKWIDENFTERADVPT